MKQIVTISGENLNVVMDNVEVSASTAGKKTKAQLRIEALQAAGVDVSNYFTLGDDKVIKASTFGFELIENDEQVIDAVGKKIVDGGYINNWSLFRRWVMSQMFHMLREMKKDEISFSGVLQRKGYEYQWRMLENEIYAQMKMDKHGDSVNSMRRGMWFNGETACYMAIDYIKKLKEYVEGSLMYKKDKYTGVIDKTHYKHTCKGAAYVRLQNENIFVSDLDKKVYSPLRKMANDMREASDNKTLYAVISKFNKTRKHLHWNTKQSNEFISAYKGSGAYFTMRNLIMFHGARFEGTSKQEASLYKLDKKAEDCVESNQMWRMLGILKQLIEDSGISIQGKIDEWK